MCKVCSHCCRTETAWWHAYAPRGKPGRAATCQISRKEVQEDLPLYGRYLYHLKITQVSSQRETQAPTQSVNTQCTRQKDASRSTEWNKTQAPLHVLLHCPALIIQLFLACQLYLGSAHRVWWPSPWDSSPVTQQRYPMARTVSFI